MNNLFTVIKFTFLGKFRSKSFLFTTLFLLVVISLAVNLPAIVSALSSDKPTAIGMAAGRSAIPEKLQAYFAQQEKPAFELVTFPDQGSAEANESMAKVRMDAGEISGYLELDESAGGVFPKVVYKSKKSLSLSKESLLQNALQAVKTEIAVEDAGLSAEQLEVLFAPVAFETVQISENQAQDKSVEELAIGYILVYAMLVLLFMSVVLYGQMIATEITSEKSSRVMEILISSVSPLKQMFGKVIGVFLLAMLQLAVMVAAAVVNLNLPHNIEAISQLGLNLGDIPTGLIVYFVIFYVTGFLLYGMLYASLGSLVSRTEDLGQALLPLVILTLASFYIGMYGINDPTAPVITVLSYIPFFTPIMMFLRIGLADPAVWEGLLGVVVMLASILLAGWISAKIYRVGVLLYGKRPSLKELRKAMKAYDA